MNFCKLLIHDIKIGIFRNKKLFCIPILVVFLVFDFKNYVSFIPNNFQITLIDYFFYYFLGASPFLQIGFDHFTFPIRWLLIMLTFCFVCSNYLTQDLTSLGHQVIINAQSKTTWWLSKCIWNISCSILIFLTMIFFTFILNFEYDISIFNFNTQVIEYMLVDNGIENVKLNYNYIIKLSIISLLLFIICINLIQITINLFIKQVFSIFISLSIIIISTFITSPLALGNYAMILKSNYINNNGVNTDFGIIFCVIISIIFIYIGIIKIKKYDFLNIKED